MSSLVVAPSAAFVVAFLLTRALAAPGAVLWIPDHPNERSLHDTPKPRTGGIAVIAGVVVGLAGARLAAPLPSWPILTAAGLVAVVSFADDVRSLSPVTRLTVQMIAALLIVVAGRPLYLLAPPASSWALPPVVVAALTTTALVWMINLFNFMDGMDGFAAGMAVIGFGSLAVAGWGEASVTFLTMSLIVVAAALAFLVHNFPPASIFLGDTGSSTLGLLAGAMSLWAHVEQWVPLWVSLLIFSPFIVDATSTLLRRAFSGDRFWEAHRSHYYQRLVQLGWGHRKTVLHEYALMVSCAASALIGMSFGTGAMLPLLLLWAAAYIALARGVRMLERRHSAEGRGGAQ